METSAHTAANRDHWNATSDEYQGRHGEQLARNPLAWGVWAIPEDEIRVLGDVAGKDVLEFGCGAAQWSIGLTKRGARCVGLDISERQLEHARENMQSAGVDFPLVHASAENVPLNDTSFDIVFCDHGAMTFADPFVTVPEVARLLRPGGLLAFSASTPIRYVCWDDENDAISTTLQHAYFGQHREDNGASACFTLTYGSWIELFRKNRLAIQSLIELQPPASPSTSYGDFVGGVLAGRTNLARYTRSGLTLRR